LQHEQFLQELALERQAALSTSRVQRMGMQSIPTIPLEYKSVLDCGAESIALR
jgi:hypothetical protein